MHEVKESVFMPGIVAHVVAKPRGHTGEELIARGVVEPGDEWMAALYATEPEYQVLDWRLTMYIPGLDARYNGGYGEVSAAQHGAFLRALQDASVRMHTLLDRQFTGQFRTSIPFAGAPRLEVVAEGGFVYLHLGLASSTGRICWVRIPEAGAANLVTEVWQLAVRGPALVDTLKQLI